MKRSRYLFTLLALLLMSITAYAQEKTFSGVVVDNADEPVIGATVVLKGTEIRTITDLDGAFKIKANTGATLVISYIGCKTEEVTVKDNMRVVLKEDTQLLNDVVVIGYGTQKKSVVTASIAKVTADDLNGKAPVRVDNALKGLAAGVAVTSGSGQPGAKPNIRIRGNGTINADKDGPLYIIDGMPLGQDALSLVNPNDIESMEVLKDAASGAIYGARAANGVILITTKKGKTGKPQINYNFSYGWQSAWKKRDVTNARDYAILMNERNVNDGIAPSYADPNNLIDVNGDPITGGGTDWQSLVFNDNAPVVNHDISISGASEKLNYYLSLGYFSQEGIVGGDKGQSNYDRLTIRSNTNYNIIDASKERSFLNKLDLTVNVAYMREHNTGIDANSEFGSVLGSALYLSPLLPVTLHGDAADRVKANHAGYDLYTAPNGEIYTVPGDFGSYNEIGNPLALLCKNPKRNWKHQIVPKFQLDLQIWDNIKYHFSYNAELAFWGYDAADKEKFYIHGNSGGSATHTNAESNRSRQTNWQVENTITYDKDFGKHSIGIVLGQSALKEKGDKLQGNHWNLVNPDKPYIDYTTGSATPVIGPDGSVVGVTVPFGVSGAPWAEHRMSSYFGRLSYNYDERYMFQGTVRRDGSSRFGKNNRYGTFPSFSVGWNVMNEAFMAKTKKWLSNMKVRMSWGKNGNDNIDDFAYTASSAGGANYLFGTAAIKFNGSTKGRMANPDLKWEESEQTDLGLDLGFFNNALTFSVDYFVKKTNGMIIEMPIPGYTGAGKPLANVGDMENKGVEFELGYKFNVADARFSVKGNASYLKNSLKHIGNADGFIDFGGINGIPGGNPRAEDGQPFPFFYGYKTDGIFQNWDEINSYVNDKGELLMPNAQPGDIRYVDVCKDGVIDAKDRTNIGKGTPDWTFGLNFNAEWRGFDFNAFFQGVTGVDIFDATYRSNLSSANFPSWVLGRWTGEGTSNSFPILAMSREMNWYASDLYVKDGSYLRLKNISLGYTIPAKYTQKIGINRFRIYVMAENLFTWTKYDGYDPEIGTDAQSIGYDKGIYPQARTWTIGFNVSL